MTKEIIIFTDGSTETNPGKGGYGAVILFPDERKELSGSYRFTTNNRMELSAAIKALEYLITPSKVTLYSDSEYLVKTMMLGWKKKKNKDLWEILIDLCKTHEVKFVWVRGHSGVTENERSDYLSFSALKLPNPETDEVYESLIKSKK